MRRTESTRIPKSPLLWSLVLVVIGVALLVHNFLLLPSLDIPDLLPLVLVVIGVQALLRGDVTPSTHTRTFGITRGNIETATIELQAAEIDVIVRSLPASNKERLIAGQYATQSRPDLIVDGTHASLSFDRSKTPWFTLADWELGLATAMPWSLIIGTHLGQLDIDCSELILDTAQLATGLGDIRLVLPAEMLGEPLRVQSTLGHITLITPPTYHARIVVQPRRFSTVHVNEHRYEQIEPNVYVARDTNPELPITHVTVDGYWGDIYLA